MENEVRNDAISRLACNQEWPHLISLLDSRRRELVESLSKRPDYDDNLRLVEATTIRDLVDSFTRR
jgi:hypothetical protein